MNIKWITVAISLLCLMPATWGMEKKKKHDSSDGIHLIPGNSVTYQNSEGKEIVITANNAGLLINGTQKMCTGFEYAIIKDTGFVYAYGYGGTWIQDEPIFTLPFGAIYKHFKNGVEDKQPTSGARIFIHNRITNLVTVGGSNQVVNNQSAYIDLFYFMQQEITFIRTSLYPWWTYIYGFKSYINPYRLHQLFMQKIWVNQVNNVNNGEPNYVLQPELNEVPIISSTQQQQQNNDGVSVPGDTNLISATSGNNPFVPTSASFVVVVPPDQNALPLAEYTQTIIPRVMPHPHYAVKHFTLNGKAHIDITCDSTKPEGPFAKYRPMYNKLFFNDSANMTFNLPGLNKLCLQGRGYVSIEGIGCDTEEEARERNQKLKVSLSGVGNIIINRKKPNKYVNYLQAQLTGIGDIDSRSLSAIGVFAELTGMERIRVKPKNNFCGDNKGTGTIYCHTPCSALKQCKVSGKIKFDV